MIQTPLPETGHPLADTVARLAWRLPVLPLVGFVLNGLLSSKHAAHAGPADPTAASDHSHGAHGHDDHAHDAHGHDDHHVARHPANKLVSLIGPGV
jgi:hypothetical protein